MELKDLPEYSVFTNSPQERDRIINLCYTDDMQLSVPDILDWYAEP